MQEVPAAPLPDQPRPSIAVPLTLLFVGLLLWLLADWWVGKKFNTNVSKWTQRMGRWRSWFRWIVIATTFMLAWHLAWGFPW